MVDEADETRSWLDLELEDDFDEELEQEIDDARVPEAVRHLQKTLTKMGLLRALKRLGAKPGHTAVIGGEEMEYQPEEMGLGED